MAAVSAPAQAGELMRLSVQVPVVGTHAVHGGWVPTAGLDAADEFGWRSGFRQRQGHSRLVSISAGATDTQASLIGKIQAEHGLELRRLICATAGPGGRRELQPMGEGSLSELGISDGATLYGIVAAGERESTCRPNPGIFKR